MNGTRKCADTLIGHKSSSNATTKEIVIFFIALIIKFVCPHSVDSDSTMESLAKIIKS